MLLLTINFSPTFSCFAFAVNLFVQTARPTCPMKMFMCLKCLNPSQNLIDLLRNVSVTSYINSLIFSFPAGKSGTNESKVTRFNQIKIVSTFLNLIFAIICTTCTCSTSSSFDSTCRGACAPFRPFKSISTFSIFCCFSF